MPWELVADFRQTPDLPESDRRWGRVATAIVTRMLSAEPRLRVILRNLPAPGTPKHSVIRLQRSEVNAAFASKLEVPEGREYLVRQYFCKTCAGKDEKPKWFPQMYLSLHKGHDIQRSPPTGRAKRHGWTPNFRMFFGSPERLRDTVPGLPSAIVTTLPKTADGLERFDWLLGVSSPEVPSSMFQKDGIEITKALPPKVDDMPRAIIAFMAELDSKLLDASEEDLEPAETPNDTEVLESIRRRVISAQAMLASRQVKKK